MKKVFLFIILAGLSIKASNAQTVYNEIFRMAKETVSNPHKSLETRKINQFKVDELNYMAMKSREIMPDSAATVLDYQALALYEYVDLFVNKLGEAKRKKEKEHILKIFKEATINNPRFFDMDTNLVMSYYNSDKFITQFSLDTDWIKALSEVRNRLRDK